MTLCRLLFTSFCTFIILFNINAQPEKRLKPEIKSATLYPNQASIQTEARFEVETGLNKIVITGLPGNISQDAIQIKPKGDISIQEVSFRDNPGRLAGKTRELILLEDSLEHAQSEFDSIVHAIEGLQLEEKLILSNMKISGENTGVKALELEDIADLYRERLPHIKNLISKNTKRRDRAFEKANRLRFKIIPLQRNRSKLSGELTVFVNANSKAPAVFEISFLTYDAGWNPSYEWKLKNTKEPIQLVYKAAAYQNTGLDWNHIKLTFSTSQPNNLFQLPQLESWRLGFEEPVITVGYGGSPSKKEMRTNADMQEEAAPMAMFAAAPATVEKTYFTGSVLEYTLGNNVTLHSDTVAHTFELKSVNVESDYKYISIPKVQKEVFVTACIPDWEKLNLMPSQTAVFVENAFLGNTYINPNSTGDTLQIPLFADKNIVVTRELMSDFSSRKLLGANIKQEFGYLITLKNNNKEAVNLVLQDQIPVSKNSQIEVEFLNESEALWEKESGKLTWKLNLTSTESRKIIIKYSVKYPKDKKVEGL